MAALNLINVATITINNAGLALTSSAQDLIAAIATSHVGMIDSVLASNVDGSVAETVTLRLVKSGPLTYHASKTISVPAGASLIILAKGEWNLMEGDKITALAGSSSKIEITAHWKDLS